ncbi:MAG TPA: ATP-binding protein [Bdellovibrionales bacterium]|nr:ATP-binding protein [Bdellovibrionales bacterium]
MHSAVDMKVSSFIRQGGELVRVEVELSLAPGLPQFHFIGLPDTALRESALRIRSAIREQGFELPKAQQVLVHLKPTHVKKTSRGLDLAIASALLWETEQLPKPDRTPIIYGELTLKGECVMPDDADELDVDGGECIITGKGRSGLGYHSIRLSELKELGGPLDLCEPETVAKPVRPLSRYRSLPPKVAEIVEIAAAGEHSMLLAGPHGSGKSTAAEVIPSLMEEPAIDDFEAMRRVWKRAGHTLTWRPVLRPHHSITPLAMIGGGASLWAGEISRANSGILIMDEMLEFDPLIQEALREPVETGSISIVRAGGSRTFSASLMLLATTNLCSCGKFVPKPKNACKCSRAQRHRVMKKLSGPFVDRFSILAFSDDWKSKEQVSIESVAERVRAAIEFRKVVREQTVPNARMDAEIVSSSLTEFQRQSLLDQGSRRRQQACLRLARTAADLRGDIKICPADIMIATELACRNHQLLAEWPD